MCTIYCINGQIANHIITHVHNTRIIKAINLFILAKLLKKKILFTSIG